jgi:hypothetical protein
MASYTTSSAEGTEIRSLEKVLATALNKQLQSICAANGLKTGGVKAELQNRIKIGTDTAALSTSFPYYLSYSSLLPSSCRENLARLVVVIRIDTCA